MSPFPCFLRLFISPSLGTDQDCPYYVAGLKWLVSTRVPIRATPTDSVLENKRMVPEKPISFKLEDGSIIKGSLVGEVTISDELVQGGGLHA